MPYKRDARTGLYLPEPVFFRPGLDSGPDYMPGDEAGATPLPASLNFTSASSQYMQRAGLAASSTVGTLAYWVKWKTTPSSVYTFVCNTTNNPDTMSYWLESGKIQVWRAGITVIKTSATFAPLNTWQHVCFSWHAGASGVNKFKLFIGGALVTAFETDARSSFPGFTHLGSASQQHIWGRRGDGTGYANVKLADIHMVEGNQYDASEFIDVGTGKRIDFAGSHGSGGYWLDGNNASNPGDDNSGNGNDFTNFGVTRDVGDVPPE